MYEFIGPRGPITCSKCASTDIVNPVNNPDVDLRCERCGHIAESRAAQNRRLSNLTHGFTLPSEPKGPPTF